jgi:hypothetical protein
MPDESSMVGVAANVTDWQGVADELAGALRTTILRNPNLTARDWSRASAALARYDAAGGGSSSAAEPVGATGESG